MGEARPPPPPPLVLQVVTPLTVVQAEEKELGPAVEAVLTGEPPPARICRWLKYSGHLLERTEKDLLGQTNEISAFTIKAIRADWTIISIVAMFSLVFNTHREALYGWLQRSYRKR